MSYAIRNTLILLATIVMLFAGGWAFIRYFYEGPIIEQKAEIEQKRANVATYTEKTAQYTIVEKQLRVARFQFENHTKQFFSNNNIALIFDYLRTINQGRAQTSMNFTLVDSVLEAQHGIINVKLSGGGTYDGLYNFISILEQSKPMTKITDLKINAQNETGGNVVMYEATVGFYFNRATSITNPALLINFRTPSAIYNPYNPLVKFQPSMGASPEPIMSDIPTQTPTSSNTPANRDGLPDISQSRLVGLVRSGVYIEDQQKEVVYIPIGGRVFMGTLEEVSLSLKTATFKINRGGQTVSVTLSISEN